MVPKRHHVMKLFKRVTCERCELRTKDGTRGLGCLACHYLGYRYEEVDPADLELKAVMVLEELKVWAKKGEEKIATDKTRSCYVGINMMIADLESGLDPEKWREIREKAAAWKILEKYSLLASRGRGMATYRDRLSRDMKEFLAQAQAEPKKKEASHE